MPRLRLEPVTRANVRAACQLTVRPDQESLVAPVAWSIASAYTVPDIAWPRLIYDDDQLVGFIMAAFDPQNPNPHYHAYLWRLNIGGDHQGRGYGQFAVDAQPRGAPARAKQADRLLPAWRKRSGRFYRRLGFLATGEFIEDEAVAERHLIA